MKGLRGWTLVWASLVSISLLGQERREEAPPPKIEVVGEERAKEAEKPKEGSLILMSGGEWDKVADEAGQIYVSRGYKGVVPGIRDEPQGPPKGEREASGPVLEWVGFQPFSTYSRVFLKVKGGNFSYSVSKPAPNKIEVRLPGVVPATRNDERFLDTRAFPSAVATIFVEAREAETLVTITLKGPATYLYRQEGPYIFVDVSM